MRSSNRLKSRPRARRAGGSSLVGVAGVLLLAIASGAPAAELGVSEPEVAVRWIGPDGDPLPFRDEAEAEEFLRTARVVDSEVIGKGTNRPTKVLLEKDGVRAHSVWRTVDQRHTGRTKGRFRHFLPYRDSYSFERAAYRLSRLLGLSFVPPVVERRKGRDAGTLQLWVEGAIDERERRLSGMQPPDQQRWVRQKDSMAVFDALIQNDDRNQGNFLIDAGWNLWLIDHTRAFVPDTRLRDPDRLQHCPRQIWERLKSLDRQEVRRVLEYDLTTQELTALFARWEKIVSHFESLIEERGEEQVLFSSEPPIPVLRLTSGNGLLLFVAREVGGQA